MSSVTPQSLDGVAAPAAPAAPKQHARVLPLDGVRGVAILLVLYGHMWESLGSEFGVSNAFARISMLGWAGVDLFFVLSGFLITGILYDAKGGEKYFKNFYIRRALRIFPLYYVALASVMLLNALAPVVALEPRENPAWMWVYMTNFVMGATGEDAFGVLDHFWSLAVEEHYYLVWPTVVFFLDRRRLMMVAAAAMVVAFILRLSMADFAAGEMSMAGYTFTPMRMDSLAAGSLLALAARGSGGLDRLFRPALIAAPVAFILFMGLVGWRWTIDPRDAFLGTFGISLLWTMFGALLVLSLTWKPLTVLMSTAFLRWFGKYSYGMYVWHPIVVITLVHTDWARELRGGDTPLHGLIVVGGALAASVLVAMISWHAFEKRFLALKDRFA